jgi:hypothetical protein
MYIIDYCPACHSKDITKSPYKLSQFVAWRSTGDFPYGQVPTMGIKCNQCSFLATHHRLTAQEEQNLYINYRGDDYNKMRLFIEPQYQHHITTFDGNDYAEKRKVGINALINKNIDLSTVHSVLDYGGDTGAHIPQVFVNAKKYVYDISGVDTIEGVETYDTATSPATVDFLMCCHTLEHKSDPDILINDLKKYVDQSTWVYIEVPNADPPWQNEFHEHINIFNCKSMTALLERHGFKIADVFENENLCMLAKLK